MENPRVVAWLFSFIVAVFLAVAVVGAVYYGDLNVLVTGLLGLGIFLLACGIMLVANIAALGPFLWLLSRLASKNGEPPGRGFASSEHQRLDDEDESLRR